MDTSKSFTLISPTFSNQVDLETVYKYTISQTSGQILDPYGKPKSGVNVTFSTKPDSMNETLNTNSQG